MSSSGSASSAVEQSGARRGTPTTLEHLVDVALDICMTRGVEAVSMRAVASRLNISPMTIYRFVASKEALLDETVLRVLDRFETPRHVRDGWDQRILGSLGAWRALLLDHPGIVQILVGRRMPADSKGLARLEEDVLTSLDLAGVTGAPAARAFWQILAHAFGHIVFELPRAALTLPEQRLACERMARVASERGFLHVHALAAELNSLEVRGTFEDSMHVFLQGVAACHGRDTSGK